MSREIAQQILMDELSQNQQFLIEENEALPEKLIDCMIKYQQRVKELALLGVVGQSEQLKPEPQICYKSNEVCKYGCSGLCKESY